MINADFLNAIRRSQGLKLREIAEKSKLSPGYVGLIFSGKLTDISEQAKTRISEAFSIPVKILFPDFTRGIKEKLRRESKQIAEAFIKIQREIAVEMVKKLSNTTKSALIKPGKENDEV